MEERTAMVCDNGTGFMKMGWAGSNFPDAMFPSLVGRPMLRFEEQVEDIKIKSLMIGDEAAKLRHILELSHPLENGIVKDWPMMTKLWEHGFYEKMKLTPETIKGKKVLLTEAPQNPKANREKMAEIMFEQFGMGGVRVFTQAILALYSEGLLTGLVIDSGDGVTHLIPVCEGYLNKFLIKRLNVAGRHVTNYLTKLLLIRGYAFNSSADFETVREIKEKVCYCSNNLEQDRKLAKETTVLDTEYTLPDGSVITIGRERFEAPECLFNPSLIDNEMDGISEMVIRTVEASDIDIRKELFKAVLLSGGTTMFPGFPTRLQTDIHNQFAKEVAEGKRDKTRKFKVKILDRPTRKNAVFIGASVCANVGSNDPNFWVTREQYQEAGMKELIHNEMLA